jgi:sugar phosphate isomerase/epimerase
LSKKKKKTGYLKLSKIEQIQEKNQWGRWMMVCKLDRRNFTKMALMAVPAALGASQAAAATNAVCLGGPVFAKVESPEQWIMELNKLGYTAAYCPIGHTASDDVVQAYENAAQKAGIIIAETGAWSNPLSPDEEERKKAYQKCVDQLALADRIGARCCVNITGSRGKVWAGHDPKNLTRETFDMIVEITRNIIDEVKPTRSYFALETMQWAYPDSVESYVDLLHAIDRDRFAVHFDPTNLVNSPYRYYNNGDIIRDGFRKLGKYIKSCHAKDIILSQEATVHLDEIRPGQGNLDYRVFLQEISQLKEVPLMLEHLPNAEEYNKAAHYIRALADEMNIPISKAL